MNGVVILCIKKQSYAAAAYNLALSIQFHSPGTHITLLSDGIHRKVFQAHNFAPFNIIKEIPQMDVAESKLSIAQFAFADCNLYIDADSLCIGDINPILEKLNGHSFKSNVIEGYLNWTSDDTFEKFFNVKPGQTINSSWIYFEKPDVFNKGLAFYKKGFPKEQLTERWGGQLPDEMFFNAAICSLNVDAKVDFNFMYFDKKDSIIPISEIKEKHSFITYYGNEFTSRLFIREFYDRVMFKICSHFKVAHKFKMPDIINNKIVNDK